MASATVMAPTAIMNAPTSGSPEQLTAMLLSCRAVRCKRNGLRRTARGLPESIFTGRISRKRKSAATIWPDSDRRMRRNINGILRFGTFLQAARWSRNAERGNEPEIDASNHVKAPCNRVRSTAVIVPEAPIYSKRSMPK